MIDIVNKTLSIHYSFGDASIIITESTFPDEPLEFEVLSEKGKKGNILQLNTIDELEDIIKDFKKQVKDLGLWR